MILIQRGVTNRISITVGEMAICSEPKIYELKVFSENTDRVQASVIMTPIDASQRVQSFDVVEGSLFSMPIDGYYTYEVRQTTSGNLCEVGLLRLGSPSESVIHSNTSTPLVHGSN